MTVTIVVLLLIAAIALILVEIFLIPGVGIPGVAGIVLMTASLVMAYNISSTVGHLTLTGTGIASVGLILLAFRSKTWSRMSVNDEITSKIEFETSKLTVGQVGKTITRLNPVGNVRFEEDTFEAQSIGDFIDDHTSVEIVTIEGNKIIVKPKIN